jgi:hypothetical protein
LRNLTSIHEWPAAEGVALNLRADERLGSFDTRRRSKSDRVFGENRVTVVAALTAPRRRIRLPLRPGALSPTLRTQGMREVIYRGYRVIYLCDMGAQRVDTRSVLHATSCVLIELAQQTGRPSAARPMIHDVHACDLEAI